MVVRERVRETKTAAGRRLIDVPGYTFRVWVTNRTESALELWRDYNQRACVEQRIEELKHDLAADGFCLQPFYATESAFLAVLNPWPMNSRKPALALVCSVTQAVLEPMRRLDPFSNPLTHAVGRAVK